MRYLRRHRTVISKLVVLIFLFQFSTSCQLSRDSTREGACNKRNQPVFEQCLKDKFPLGSSYSDLEDFLLEDGFRDIEASANLDKNEFYFKWSPIPWLGNISNYAVIVVGRHDEDRTIVELVVR